MKYDLNEIWKINDREEEEELSFISENFSAAVISGKKEKEEDICGNAGMYSSKNWEKTI